MNRNKIINPSSNYGLSSVCVYFAPKPWVHLFSSQLWVKKKGKPASLVLTGNQFGKKQLWIQNCGEGNGETNSLTFQTTITAMHNLHIEKKMELVTNHDCLYPEYTSEDSLRWHRIEIAVSCSAELHFVANLESIRSNAS